MRHFGKAGRRDSRITEYFTALNIMKDTALYFLHKVAKNLPNNQFAKALFNQLKNAGDDIKLDEWKLLDIRYDEEALLEEMDYTRIKRKQDYRFRYLGIKEFRKFPSSIDGNHFGVSFCCNDNNHVTQSTLLLGGNGTGKTSLFGAMEYLFTQNMSAANMMGYHSREALSTYLPYADKKIFDVDIQVETNATHFNIPSDILPLDDVRRLCLLPFFCSEYDVDKLIERKHKKFIYEQMGYTLVVDIIDKLDKEIRNAISKQDSLKDPYEKIESRIAELDKKIGMYELLKPSFLYLVIGLNNEKNAKKKLDTLKNHLSKDFVQKMSPGQSEKFKLLNHKNLQAEKNAMTSALGRNIFTQRYIQYEEYLRQKSDNQSSTSNAQSAQNADIADITESIEDFNYTRSILNQTICNLLDIEKLSDFNFCVGVYDAYIQELVQEKDRKEKELDTRKKEESLSRKYMTNGKDYDEVLNNLKSEVYGTVKTITEGSRNLLDEIMNIFVMEDERMHFDFDEKTGDFKTNIMFVPSGNEFTIPLEPEHYLNAFRYKLYCMTLKMAVAFAMKSFYEINFPIVIDDLFYSSDFTHRNMVNEFFFKLYEKHQKLFPEKELQVIFFSHDEVVIEAAYRGIREAKAHVGRQFLFDFKEAEPQDKVTIPITVSNEQSNDFSFTKLTDSLEYE